MLKFTQHLIEKYSTFVREGFQSLLPWRLTPRDQSAWFTREQRFLYTRIAILIANVLWLAFAFAGFKGFPFWYGGFVFFFWLAFGLVNLPLRSSLFECVHRPHLFALLYLALAAIMFFADQFGLQYFLWVYPNYSGFSLVWLYLVLYPFSGLALIELLHFLGARLDTPLSFVSFSANAGHRFLDAAENVLFLVMTGLIIAGALGERLALSLTAFAVLLWILTALARFFLHIRNRGHSVLVLVLTVFFATVLNEYPNLISREWVYLPASALGTATQTPMLGLSVWIWLGWFWLTLIPLRLWIFLALHPKVR